jgi:hypothetical protein
MQRSEWCLDDYIVMDKLYTGYASVGKWEELWRELCGLGTDWAQGIRCNARNTLG